MLRALLYRMAKSRLLWGYLAAFAAFEAFALNSTFEFVYHDGFPPDSSVLELWGYLFVQGSFLAAFVGSFSACFIAADFKDGFAKNLMQARGGRASYAVVAIATALVAAVGFTLAAIAIAQALLAATGASPMPPSLADFARWFSQVVVIVAAYASIAVFVVLVTKSSTVGVLAAVFLGFGSVEYLLTMAAMSFPDVLAAVGDFLGGYLYAGIVALSHGLMLDAGIYVAAAATIAATLLVSVAVMRKRSVA